MNVEIKEIDQLVWGKSEPRVPLVHHLIEVGACVKVYLEARSSKGVRMLLSEWLGQDENSVIATIGYIFSLHDIGKIHPSFQFRIDEVRDEWIRRAYDPIHDAPTADFRHEVYSEQVMNACWEENRLFPRKVKKLFAAVLRLHHQGKNADAVSGGNKSPWIDIQNDYEKRMRALFCPIGIEREEEVHNRDALGVLLTGLIVLADWVASSEYFGVCDIDADDEACLAWAVERSHETLSAYGLISDVENAFPAQNAFDAMWPNIQRETMRPLQRVCEQIGHISAQLTIIEAPPGEGKTEAALYLAGQLCASMNKRGVYMALPTTATSNQMVDRVRKLMGMHGLGETRLLHGSAWMMDEKSPDESAFSVTDGSTDAANWLRPLRRALLSENAVGTVDQAMASVLLIKYGMLRLTGLANKVLIVDEIHAYDSYMTRILVCLMQWCHAMRIPVILLSATLHKKQKEEYLKCFTDVLPQTGFQEYPLITQVDQAGNLLLHPIGETYMRTECDYRAISFTDDVRELAKHILDRARMGGCYCVMLNTVRRAQQVYEALLEAGEDQVRLFHARYRMRRRAEIEAECLRMFGRNGDRPKRMILVCTQVVEQSLDLDFDGMLSELAPVDLLIQRAGRIHRHSENHRPENMKTPILEVIVPPESAPQNPEARYGVLSAVYAVAELRNTEMWLGKGRIIRVPEDVRAAVDAVYEHFDPANVEIYALKQAKDNMSRVSAEGCIYREPKENQFFGTISSQCQNFILSDCDDLALRHSGAKTREGEDTVRVAFLPPEFDFSGTEKECAKKILLESASIRLTDFDRRANRNTNENHKVGKMNGNRYLMNCTVVFPEQDGSYTVSGRRFLADDVIGIREV